MDPYSSPYIIPKNSPQYPFPHSLLGTRQKSLRCGGVLWFDRVLTGFGFRGVSDGLVFVKTLPLRAEDTLSEAEPLTSI